MPKKSNVQFVRKVRTLKPKVRKPPKRKNISQKIPNGTIVRTRDEYFENAENYRKPGYENKGYYRGAIVLDSNRNNELALGKASSSGYDFGSKVIKRVNVHIETKNHKNQPIRLGKYYIKTNKSIPIHQVNAIKKQSLKNSKQSICDRNRSKLRELKGRK